MRTNSWLGGFALAVVAGCGGAGASDDDDTSGGPSTAASTDPSTGVESSADETSTGAPADDECVPGWESCPCYEDDRCISGLQCLSHHCVRVPDASTSDTLSDTTGEGSTTDASTEESSSTGLPDVCWDDDTYCEFDELATCVDGQWEEMECEDYCLLTGSGGTTCADADRCACAGHSDATCDAASYNHCICLDALYGDPSCTVEEQESQYQACFMDTTPANTCWAMYQITVIEDCEMAVAECGA